MTMNDSPQVVRSGITPGIKPLFHSRREIALLKDTCVKPGFGILKQGTVLAASVADELMTPNPIDAGTAALDIARVRIAADAVTTESTVTISEADAAKFRVGDSIVINNSTPIYEDLGAITAISAPSSGIVTVTFTTALASGDLTTALHASISHKTAAASPFYKASCVLDKDVDSGASSTDQPAPTSVVFGNAMLYTVWLIGMSAKAITDLGAKQHGVHTMF